MITNYIFLFYLLQHITSATNPGLIQVRNTGFRMIIFKEKVLPKILQRWKGLYESCRNKSVFYINTGMVEYYNLSEEDRTIIESIFSLCY